MGSLLIFFTTDWTEEGGCCLSLVYRGLTPTTYYDCLWHILVAILWNVTFLFFSVRPITIKIQKPGLNKEGNKYFKSDLDQI